MNIAYMFYADDAVFVGRWCDGNINTLIHVLDCFHRASKVGGNMSRISAWKEVIDKVRSRLSKWKSKTLSIGGRLTLLKSVLGSIPIFYMSLYRVSKKVLSTLESIRSHFFNGHDSNNKKASWNGGVNKVVSGSNSCWRNIVKEVLALQDQDRFPRVYALETCKQVLVSAKLIDLNSSLRRNTRGGVEQAQFNTMTELMATVNLVTQADRYVWTLNGFGEYSMASMRKILDDFRAPTTCSPTRWVQCVPIKINVFAWKVKMDVLPTRFNISRRGMDIDYMSCSLCDNGVESSNHMFFSCSLVRHLYRKISAWWDVPFRDVHSYMEWLEWLVTMRLSSKLKDILEGVFFVLWWLIWSFRNKVLFDTKKPQKATLFDDIASISFYWCKIRCKASFSWNDWFKNPYLIIV
nr:RNA-directed DNA polymerase, eukaryota [Tanacetum cinerariifolium]